MTREEAIEVLKLVDENASCDDCLYYAQMEDCPTDEDCIIRQALEMAIQALSQEPCDDAISREDAEQMFRNIRSHLKPQDYKSAEEFNTRDLMLLNAEQMIHALPSVTPSRYVNCEIAEHDGNGCLGYSRYGDDFPIKECLNCPKYTSYEEELRCEDD